MPLLTRLYDADPDGSGQVSRRAEAEVLSAFDSKGAPGLIQLVAWDLLADDAVQDGPRFAALSRLFERLFERVDEAYRDRGSRFRPCWRGALAAAFLERLKPGDPLEHDRAPDPPEVAEGKQRELAAKIWENLAAVHPEHPACEPAGRWFHPLPHRPSSTATDRVEALFQQVETACKRRYFLPFPTVLSVSDEDPGPLFDARITLLEDVPDTLPRLVLAPWCRFQLRRWKSIARLLSHPALDGLLRAEGNDTAPEVHWMLDLRLLDPDSPTLVPRLEIEGISLTLSLCLAAWAAAHRSELRSLIATGGVGTGGEILRVDGIRPKFLRVNEYANSNEIEYCFFYPEKNDIVLEATDWTKPIRLDRLSQIVKAPEEYLTDGFDLYRETIAQESSWSRLFDEESCPVRTRGEPRRNDVAAGSSVPCAPCARVIDAGLTSPGAANDGGCPLDEWDRPGRCLPCDQIQIETRVQAIWDSILGGRSRDRVGRIPLITLPFDQEPARAARFLIQRLVTRIIEHGHRRETHRRLASPADLRIPIPCPLHSGRPAGIDLPASIAEGIDDFAKRLDVTPLVRPQVLANALSFDRSKLVLVAYSGPSRSVRYGTEGGSPERASLQAIKDFVGERADDQPRFIMICSDDHHESFCRGVLDLGSGAAAP